MPDLQLHQRKYQRYQVFAHIDATRGYTSRAPNGRRGIPTQDKYPETTQPPPPQEIKTYAAAAIDNIRIRIHVNESNETQ